MEPATRLPAKRLADGMETPQKVDTHNSILTDQRATPGGLALSLSGLEVAKRSAIEGSDALVTSRATPRQPHNVRVGPLNPERIVMKNFAQKVQRFLTSEDGPTAVEYAVMLALFVIVCLTAIRSIGTNANVTFDTVATELAS